MSRKIAILWLDATDQQSADKRFFKTVICHAYKHEGERIDTLFLFDENGLNVKVVKPSKNYKATEKIFLGYTEKTIEELTKFADQLNQKRTYDEHEFNCDHFSNELSLYLLDKPIPKNKISMWMKKLDESTIYFQIHFEPKMYFTFNKDGLKDIDDGDEFCGEFMGHHRTSKTVEEFREFMIELGRTRNYDRVKYNSRHFFDEVSTFLFQRIVFKGIITLWIDPVGQQSLSKLVYHTSICYEGFVNDNITKTIFSYNENGVGIVPASLLPYGVVELGWTNVGLEKLRKYSYELSEKSVYDPNRMNCNHFSNILSLYLLQKNIPAEYFYQAKNSNNKYYFYCMIVLLMLYVGKYVLPVELTKYATTTISIVFPLPLFILILYL